MGAGSTDGPHVTVSVSSKGGGGGGCCSGSTSCKTTASSSSSRGAEKVQFAAAPETVVSPALTAATSSSTTTATANAGTIQEPFESSIGAPGRGVAGRNMHEAAQYSKADKPTSQLTPLWACKFLYFLQLGCAASLVRFLVVLYTDLGIGPKFIGYLMCLDPLMCFVGQIFWASICDFTKVHKLVLSISSGLAVVFYLGLNAYKENLTCVFVFVGLAAFCRAGAQGIQDALCLSVLKQHSGAEDDESYGGQRMWGAVGWGTMAFLTGFMVDHYGTGYMFVSYTVGTLISITVLLVYFPGGAPGDLAVMSPTFTPAEARRKKLLRFRAMWFFANLVVYGTCMAMVETFLFVYLERDFQPPAEKSLLGLSIAVMCLFELPVFFYFNRALEILSERTVLNLCHLVFALRCLLYVMLPRDQVWTVLLVEPLHGVTFAAMWTASVHYAQNNAPRGLETTMQAVCNGLYQQLGFSIGSLFWGRVIDSYGFDFAYYACGVVVLVWGAVWALGWRIHEKYEVQNVALQRKLLFDA
ncbi:unnamed protein product [Amoebophrya sp. A120]|nr:unnamed protein product [Amoebophrya sp. A120]|eukprot:GSA120T00008981001.1